MPSVKKSAIVPYTAEQMYHLVDHIEAYSEFLPWCKHSEVLFRNEDEVHASLTASWKGIEKSFSTCNRLQHNKMIEMKLKEGPFQNLEGFWQFEALGQEGCKISFDLEFEFSTKLLSMMLGPIFTQMTASLVDAFSQRAQQLYGKK